jgi:hypothetical protein
VCQTEPADSLTARRAGRVVLWGSVYERLINWWPGPSGPLPWAERGSRRNAPLVARDRAMASVAEDNAGKLAELARPSSLGGDDGDARGRMPPCQTEPAGTLASAA